MSKAFTKEDGPEEEGPDEESGPAIPVGAKNYITPAGAARLREELHQLLHVARPETVRTVSWAASNGDRSENGDYIYGKRRLREIDRRIRFLTKRLEAAEIVDPSAQALTSAADQVLFGATVTVRDEEERLRTYRIVGIDEAKPALGDVSWISPIARALLNHRVGEVVTLRTPKGEEDLEITKIRFV